MEKIRIFDTTLRDGEQSPGNSMDLSEKLSMARQLERLGVDVIEAGFPIASPEDFNSVKAIAESCKKTEVCGLARAMEKDIQRTWEAIQFAKKPRIHTFLATSEVHMKYKLKKTRKEVMEMTVNAVQFAKSLCDRVDFSPEDAFRSDRNFLYQVLELAIEAGADVVNIPDTVGYASPEEFGKLIKDIKENVPNIQNAIISTHCHNDLGLAVANSLAGVMNGARQVECTINGIGERAGNAALEEIVMNLKTRPQFYKIDSNINTKELYPSSRLLSSITGAPVQPNKAIIGANAFSHESGIHQDGILKERSTYEIMKAEDIGMKSNQLVLGKHSGRHALQDRMQLLGYKLEENELNQFFDKFKIHKKKKKKIYDADLLLLINQNNEQKASYTLVDLEVVTGTKKRPHSKVWIEDKNGKVLEAESEGDGPVDASFQAVNKVIKIKNKLMEYSVNAVTAGIDAQATVAIQIKADEQIFSDSDSDTDIVVASTKAYISALNKIIFFNETKNNQNAS